MVRLEDAMTKSQESGENEITVEAKREAKRTGESVCAILARMLDEARADGDREGARKIIRAQ